MDLPRSFPVEVEVELDKIPDKVLEEELVNRKDLRELPMVTIDGEDAKDLDDAVSMEDLGEESPSGCAYSRCFPLCKRRYCPG